MLSSLSLADKVSTVKTGPHDTDMLLCSPLTGDDMAEASALGTGEDVTFRPVEAIGTVVISIIESSTSGFDAAAAAAAVAATGVAGGAAVVVPPDDAAPRRLGPEPPCFVAPFCGRSYTLIGPVCTELRRLATTFWSQVQSVSQTGQISLSMSPLEDDGDDGDLDGLCATLSIYFFPHAVWPAVRVHTHAQKVWSGAGLWSAGLQG